MKKILIFVFILGFPALCQADRICIQKSTGKVIEYQSGNSRLGTLTENALNAGYNMNDIEEKEISPEEWKRIREEKIDKPAKEVMNQKKEALKIKAEAIKIKLKLTDQEWTDLIEIIRN